VYKTNKKEVLGWWTGLDSWAGANILKCQHNTFGAQGVD